MVAPPIPIFEQPPYSWGGWWVVIVVVGLFCFVFCLFVLFCFLFVCFVLFVCLFVFFCFFCFVCFSVCKNNGFDEIPARFLKNGASALNNQPTAPEEFYVECARAFIYYIILMLSTE